MRHAMLSQLTANADQGRMRHRAKENPAGKAGFDSVGGRVSVIILQTILPAGRPAVNPVALPVASRIL